MSIRQQGSGVMLELSALKGNGRYQVQDALMTEAILTTVTRIAKRQLLIPTNDDEVQTRKIQPEVKIAVWQRDQGKCVECSASSYLEFDHVIPFSKGGANTVNNIQLLCRRCNLQKSDRI
jgi:5-methylcytosine-specific restriction endonuclease McrA